MNIYFGIDIGGTDTKIGSFSETGALIHKWNIKTDYSNQGTYIIPNASATIKQYLDDREIPYEDAIGIGIGIPGPMRADGFVENCVNLGWKGINPEAELKKYFPDSCTKGGNDANMAALAEYWMGAGKGYSSMMLVTLGTGVGGGIIVDGKIITGAHGLAGEIGHMGINHQEMERCNCNNRGCIDQIASARGIVRYTNMFMHGSREETALRNIPDFTARDVAEHALKGDKIALQSLRYCMSVLGRGLAYASHILDPEVYVIGGGVSAAGELIISMIKEEFDQNIFLTEHRADIRTARLGNDAGIYGSAKLVIDNNTSQ